MILKYKNVITVEAKTLQDMMQRHLKKIEKVIGTAQIARHLKNQHLHL